MPGYWRAKVDILPVRVICQGTVLGAWEGEVDGGTLAKSPLFSSSVARSHSALADTIGHVS